MTPERIGGNPQAEVKALNGFEGKVLSDGSFFYHQADCLVDLEMVNGNLRVTTEDPNYQINPKSKLIGKNYSGWNVQRENGAVNLTFVVKTKDRQSCINQVTVLENGNFIVVSRPREGINLSYFEGESPIRFIAHPAKGDRKAGLIITTERELTPHIKGLMSQKYF